MKPIYAIIHNTESVTTPTNRQFNTVNRLHQQLFNMKSSLGYYCGYHYFIEVDGFTIQARADTDVGAHTLRRNGDSIGICLAGNFDVQMPSDAQISALKALLLQKMREWSIPEENILPHRYFATTSLRDGKFVPNTSKFKTWDGCQPYKTCPGKNIADNWGQILVAPPPQVVSTEEVGKAIGILERIIRLLKDYLEQRKALGDAPYQRNEAV